MKNSLNRKSNEGLLSTIVGSDIINLNKDRAIQHILVTLKYKYNSLCLEDLTSIDGVNSDLANKLLAYKELFKRFESTEAVIDNLSSIVSILTDIKNKTQEHFILLTIDGADHLINKYVVFVGTLNASLVHPRDIFSYAIKDNAARIIVAHNHPGGTTKPSQADIEVTKRITDAGLLLGIPLMKHIILTKDDAIEVVI